MNKRVKAILDFWFNKSSPKDWFSKKDNFDKKIKDNFFGDYKKAFNNELDKWENTPQGCLALIILLDQFSRNLFRNNSKAYAADKKTRLIVKKAINRRYLEELSINQINFMILPLIHSENLKDHEFAHGLIDIYLKNHKQYKKIKKMSTLHTNIIKKFGRYPHRNKVLERKSTKEEKEFLKKPNSSF